MTPGLNLALARIARVFPFNLSLSSGGSLGTADWGCEAGDAGREASADSTKDTLFWEGLRDCGLLARAWEGPA